VSTRSLPPRPNLDQLKLQANELHRAHRDGDTSAAARIVAHHPAMKRLSPNDVLERPFALADAQLVLAREYGLQNWAQLKQRIELVNQIDQFKPHPGFGAALAALDSGDVERLRALITADPSLLHARTNLEPPYGYFSGATLLHHAAGNPYRDKPLPGNVVELARVLLDAGADVNARTLGPNGGDTMGLLVTGKQASDMGVTGPLMDLLLQRGAQLDLTNDDVFDASLANHSPAAAEKMIQLGARPDVLVVAALGRMDLLRGCFDSEGRLKSLPRRHGKELSARDAIGLAALYAYVREQREAVDFLLDKDGNWDMTGVNNGTLVHRAAWEGDLEMVQRLVAKGADISNRDNPFHSTPLSWAQHNKQPQVFDWLRANCAIDLHEAVCHDFPEHVEARLREDPGSINRQIDHWDLPQCTALHWAAWTKIEDIDGLHSLDPVRREELVKLLLEKGADPNIIAGNGVTALDMADACGATRIAALLEQHGAKRTTEAAKPSSEPKLKQFEKVAADIALAYRSDDADALERIQQFFNRRVTFHDIRTGARTRLQRDRDFAGEISVAEARDVVAGLRGFASWADLAESVTRRDSRASSWAMPPYVINEKDNRIEVRDGVKDEDWDAILDTIADKSITDLHANGQMTDAVMERLVALEHLTHLSVSNSKGLTDVGLRQLARLPRLQQLDLSGCAFTDRGLDVLRALPALTTFSLFWHHGVTDAGLANLTFCDQLERVDLLGTPVGDGVVNALTGKRRLRHLKTGTQVTDTGLPLLHRFPVFKTWHDGNTSYDLMSFDVDSNFVLLDGPFTDRGLRSLIGLDGVFGLNFFWHSNAFTPGGLEALAGLANLGFLGCDGKRCNDEAMRHIAAIPRLRMLLAQGTVATDDGFSALSRSQTLEYLWGRECPNLTGHGFAALSSMPSLRGLAVSCKNVDDRGLATLPQFPALTQLMPMDVQDAGFRHVGRCQNLERLWCMYCRNTTDEATGHIAGLSKLRTYYAGQTKITDRSLDILGRMTSLETLEFWNIAGITNTGVHHLARLPRLREVTFDRCRHISQEAAAVFPAGVHVKITG
jgi:ankyrin repeat protein